MFIPYKKGKLVIMDRKNTFWIFAGIGIAVKIGYSVVSSIRNGSRFLDSYVNKVEEIGTTSKMVLEEDGYYSIVKTENKPFKVLQLTDIHLGGGYLSRHEDMQALGIVWRLIKSTKPDMIVITGDLAYPKAHVTLSRNNLNSYRIITDMLEKIGIPYAITFGNHDTTEKSTHTRRELRDFLLSKEHSLLVNTEDNENLTGFSNYYVKLKNSDNKLNSVIVMLDSNEYIKSNKKRTYDYIHDDQVRWYEKITKKINKKEGRKVPSYLYFHIPIKEYKEAWKSSVDAKDSSRYFYGCKDENISPSKFKSKLFSKVLELDSTKGLFCGHDHLNDFSVEYKGVRFTYGQAIDCLLYAKNLSEHKGATILKIDKYGNFSIKGKKHR